MSVKSDRWIRRMALEHGMIEPFVECQKREGVISYGLSSYGYDMRVGRKFKIFKGVAAAGFNDPKRFDAAAFEDATVEEFAVILPHSFVLAQSVEYFRIPRNILTVCTGKSTYARCGILVNITPFEPEWEGFVTMGISNTTPLPAKIYADEGIAQVLFFESDEVCETSYADRKGKYQKQTEITLPKL
ncbi:MAG: dCTP deaminase [Elusimicrobia bacterium]|nr:dCTP deaminase [Elusimicrobiota bacterium]